MKHVNKIDLSKIKVKQLVEKKIKSTLTGESADYYIHSLSDGDKADIISILSDKTSPYRMKNLYIALLSAGMDIDSDVAEVLYQNNPIEVARVAQLIQELDSDFDFLKNEEAKEAEKNSSEGTAN
jgi:hypothetical protein